MSQLTAIHYTCCDPNLCWSCHPSDTQKNITIFRNRCDAPVPCQPNDLSNFSVLATGVGEMEAYEPDCTFADPFTSFDGVERFKKNVSNLGGLL